MNIEATSPISNPIEADFRTQPEAPPKPEDKTPTARLQKKVTPLEQTRDALTMLGVSLSFSSPFSFTAGAPALAASAALTTWDKIAETSKAWETAKTTKPGDPNPNKVLNTNDRSILDHHQAVNGMLEGQLNHSRSVFMKHKEGDKEFLAYKYDDGTDKPGADVRYGKIELDPTTGKFKSDWQHVTDPSLKAVLDKAHEIKMDEIKSYTKEGEDRSAGVERYRAAESVKHDLEVLGSLTNAPEVTDGLAKLQAQLADKKNIDPVALKTEFNKFLENGFMGDRLANNRANALREKGLIDKTDTFDNATAAEKNKIIDKAINKLRDEQQALTGVEETKLDLSKIGDLQEITNTLKFKAIDLDKYKLITSRFTEQEQQQLKSLMSAGEKLRNSYNPDKPDTTQAKYTKGELDYLNSQIEPFLQKLKQASAAQKSTEPNVSHKAIPIPRPPSQNLKLQPVS